MELKGRERAFLRSVRLARDDYREIQKLSGGTAWRESPRPDRKACARDNGRERAGRDASQEADGC